MGGIIEGRVTYQLMEEFWPTADQDPDSTPAMAEFAGIWRRLPKFVFSRTLTTAGPNAKVIAGVVPEEIQALKAEAAGDLIMSGADLAGTFMRHGLVDEFRIYVQPVVIGQGRRPSSRRSSLLTWTWWRAAASATGWSCCGTEGRIPAFTPHP